MPLLWKRHYRSVVPRLADLRECRVVHLNEATLPTVCLPDVLVSQQFTLGGCVVLSVVVEVHWVSLGGKLIPFVTRYFVPIASL